MGFLLKYMQAENEIFTEKRAAVKILQLLVY